MITPYNFDAANLAGNKEAVIVPNVPTLVNKLSANETNGIRNKINELVSQSNLYATPIAFLELRLLYKGQGNTANTLQIGDVVHGFKEAGVIWDKAIYNGGDINDRNNYTPLFASKPDPQLFTAGTTGTNQQFTLTIPFEAGTVLKSRGELFKGTEWTQTDDTITILVNVNSGNTIYVKP